MKKAVLVGINYTNTPNIALRGCINDIVNISEVLIDSYDYDINNIVQLRDDTNDASKLPTRNNILSQLTNLVNQSSRLTEIWFHYSGHGSQIRDTNGDEADRLDEVLVPMDYQTKGFIIDDEIFNIVKNSKCKTILVFDSCHSGSVCDLQWSFQYTNGSIMKSLNTNKTIINPNVFCFSGCKDPQTSADAYSLEQQQGVGAFTDSFIHCLRVNHMTVDILKLYSDICVYINSSGFTQVPVLSCSSVNPAYTFTRSTAAVVSKNTTPIVPTASVPTTTTKEISIQNIVITNKLLDVVSPDLEEQNIQQENIFTFKLTNQKRYKGVMSNMLGRL